MTALTMSDASKDLPRHRYMLSIHHGGIITNGQFDDVQKAREHRSNIEFDKNGARQKKMQYGAELKIGEDSSTPIKSTTHFANTHTSTPILLMIAI